MAEELTVILAGRKAGTISRVSRYSDPTFTYDEEYLQTGTVPLSTRMPLAPGVASAKRLASFLEGLLPENQTTRQRWATNLAADDASPFALLSKMGWECPGAVQFARTAEVDLMLARADEFEPTSDEQIAERLTNLRLDSAAWTLPEEHWSLAGQQEKFALARRADRWYTANGSAPTTHIFKPGIGRLHHQALVEYATMRAADASGVDVAEVELTHFGDEIALVIERFDRIDVGGTVRRVHQEDFCQASGRLPANKYEAPNGPGLDDMAGIVRSWSADVRSDRWALADFIAINYVTGAPDGHSKNISLALWPGDTHIAPLYDLATAFPYEGSAYKSVAVGIGGGRDFGNVLGKHWDRAARTIGIEPEMLRHRVADLAGSFPDAFADVLAELGTGVAKELRDRAMPRLQAHVEQLTSRLDDPQDPDEDRSRRPAKRASAQPRRERGKTSQSSNIGSFRPREAPEADPIDLVGE